MKLTLFGSLTFSIEEGMAFISEQRVGHYEQGRREGGGEGERRRTL